MADAKERIAKAAEQLKQQRDELRVKLHLAKAGDGHAVMNGGNGRGKSGRVVGAVGVPDIITIKKGA